VGSVLWTLPRGVARLWREPAERLRSRPEDADVRGLHGGYRIRAHVGVGSPEPKPVAGYMRGWWSPRGVPPSSNSKTARLLEVNPNDIRG
jgi:hypothetical protein